MAAKASKMLIAVQAPSKQQIGRRARHLAQMAKQTVRRTVADNLRRLMRMGAAHGLPASQAELSRRAGVAQTSISNWLDDSRGVTPGIDKLEAIAAVYGLEPWQLLVPDLPDDMLLASHLKRLVANYGQIGNPAAREYIDRVAEAEAGYTPKQKR